MKMRNKIYAITGAAIVAVALSTGAPNPANLGNGWYNLPPVTVEMFRPIAACLVMHGAPAAYELKAEGVFDWGDGRNLAPTEVRWTLKSGKVFTTDAVLTTFAPGVAYIELWKADHNGALPSREQFAGLNNCASEVKSPNVIVSMKNPLGEKQPAAWCMDKLQVAECWQGNRDDQFTPGGEFRDGTTTYRKVSGGYFFFTWSAWRKV